MNNKGKKTSTIAYIALVLIIALFIALFLDKITADELFKGLGAIGTAAALFIGFLSKDQTASHTTDITAGIGDDIPPPEEEEEPV